MNQYSANEKVNLFKALVKSISLNTIVRIAHRSYLLFQCICRHLFPLNPHRPIMEAHYVSCLRDKSWEAIMYVQFAQSTKKIKEIQFTAPSTRVYELMTELEKTLGYKLVGSQGQMDIYENKAKNLGVKIVSTELFGKGVALLRIYRL